jgi:hypothetical protein
MRRAYRAGVGRPVGRRLGAEGDLDAQGALEVRAPHLGAELLQDLEHVGVGMTVAVVRADADHRDGSTCRAEERGIGGRRAVVWDREQVDVELRRRAEQVGLRRPLRVAGEQHPAAAGGRTQHERGLVQLAALVPVGAPWRRTEHLERQRADRDPIARGDVAHRHVSLGGHRQQLGDLGQLGRDRAVPDRAHVESPQHRRGAADVVEMTVADHQQIE